MSLQIWKRAGGHLRIVIALAVAAAGFSAYAAPETFDSLTQKADAIVLGKCVAKKCVVRRGVFITTHQIQVAESLKGKAYKAGQTISVASLGGSFSAPPVSQYVNDQPMIAEGEDVLLFLQEPSVKAKAKAAEIPELASSARVIAGGKGKFSVITDPKDNQRKVVRVRCEDYGVLPDERLLRTILRALEKGELETTNPASLIDLGGGVKGPESAKPIFDNAVRVADNLRKSNPEQFQQQMQQNLKPIPAPTLAEVKERISRVLSVGSQKSN